MGLSYRYSIDEVDKWTRACKYFVEIRLSVVQLLLDVPKGQVDLVLRSIELEREVRE
jgi:hypothetical protein